MVDFALPAAYLFAINAVCFAAFVHDKRMARLGRWRVSERMLLLLALAGGTPAAYAARYFARHKTRKQPFVALLHAIALLQLAAIGLAIVRPDVPIWIAELLAG